MAIVDIPLLSMLRDRLQWHQQRQRLLAENVANSDTPNYRPRDLRQLDFSSLGTAGATRGGLALMRSDTMHIQSPEEVSDFETDPAESATTPAGNAVSLEEEMMKVAQNQMDFQTATALYSRSLGLLKTALGKS